MENTKDKMSNENIDNQDRGKVPQREKRGQGKAPLQTVSFSTFFSQDTLLFHLEFIAHAPNRLDILSLVH